MDYHVNSAGRPFISDFVPLHELRKTPLRSRGNVVLRGHHSTNFRFYVDNRDKGESHREILDRSLRVDRDEKYGRPYGDDAMEYGIERYRQIYEGEAKTVTLTTGLGDLCAGSDANGPAIGCLLFEQGNCLGKDLIEEDEWYIDMLGIRQGEPFPAREFLERIRRMRDPFTHPLMRYHFRDKPEEMRRAFWADR
ncbi:MAG: hypothetical protein HYW25_04065 [Candidatus Aenigmarchaeota archaeon]|nr:hypothetical protein [Candidatus Aenigmarchaeota archaeon]